MSAPDLAARIAFALGLAIPIGACAGAQSDGASTTGAGGASATGGASGTTATGPALQVALGPGEVALPTDLPQCPPEPPHDGRIERRGGCMIDNRCQPPLEAPPERHYPAPFERCELSLNHPMGSAFSAEATLEMRKRGADVCCYAVKQLHPAGRPQRESGVAQVAALVERGDWLATISTLIADGSDRATLAAHFRRAGQIEHSSIASFSTTVLALLSLGAPASLVEETQRAALDELEHAKLCFGLAAALDGRAIGPGPFPQARVSTSVADLVESLVIDGCLGEVAGALEAEESAGTCDDPAIRTALERIARDEAAHAELAYRTLAWLLEAHPFETRRAATAARAQLYDITVSHDTGRTRIAERALREVAEPLLGAMLS